MRNCVDFFISSMCERVKTSIPTKLKRYSFYAVDSHDKYERIQH